MVQISASYTYSSYAKIALASQNGAYNSIEKEIRRKSGCSTTVSPWSFVTISRQVKREKNQYMNL